MSLDIEICWTGETQNRKVRKTGPALSSILSQAECNILIVGYSIEPSATDIMDMLEKKSREGVRLTFMINRLDEKKGFLEWTKRLDRRPELYTRPADFEDFSSSLHIKCIVVDNKVAMFGSANMTYHGMQGNRELGLIIRDVTAVKTIIELLDELKTYELVEYY